MKKYFEFHGNIVIFKNIVAVCNNYPHDKQISSLRLLMVGGHEMTVPVLVVDEFLKKYRGYLDSLGSLPVGLN